LADDRFPAVFLDTSIQIARVVHSAQAKERIRQRLALHQRTATSLVVRQEFKRRLLKEADYLLRQLDKYKSYHEVYHHLTHLTGSQFTARKSAICLQMLGEVHQGDDATRTKRLKLYLRSLLMQGLRRFDQQVDTLIEDSGCGFARVEVAEKEPFRRYEFGPEHCGSARAGRCGIVEFLTLRRDDCQRVLRHLRSLPADARTPELQRAEGFLSSVIQTPQKAREKDPCLAVGDLIIALESAGVACVYTFNSAESQHLCRALGQTLIVRPVEALHDDIVCASSAERWPAFGKKAGKPGTGTSPEKPTGET
jgi:hypothetical protein